MRLLAPCLDVVPLLKCAVLGSRALPREIQERSEFLSPSVPVNRGFTLFLDSGSYQTQPLPPNTAFTLHKLVDLTPKSAFLELSSEQTNSSLWSADIPCGVRKGRVVQCRLWARHHRSRLGFLFLLALRKTKKQFLLNLLDNAEGSRLHCRKLVSTR